jgi:predicted DNA-binding transcriptional regulator AlpA
MPKKPKKPIPDSLLSIDATPETAKLDGLLMLKHTLQVKYEADQRDVVSVKVALTMLGMSRSKLYELLEAGSIVSLPQDRSRKIIVRTIHLYKIKLVDQAIDVETERMDRLGIPGAEEWLNPTRKA